MLLLSPAYVLAMELLGAGGRRAAVVGGGGEVAASVCIMLWMRWFDC